MRKFSKKIKVLGGLAVLAISIMIPVNAFAYEYWGPYEMIGGISSGVYMNNAVNNYSYNGTTYDFGTAFNGAFNEWNNLTESNILNDLNYDGTTKMRTEGQNYGNLNLYGWAEMRKGGMFGTRVNAQYGATGPSEDWDFAWVYVNAYDINEDNLSYSQYRAVAIHEVGHGLGLAHERDGVAAVMNDQLYLSNGWLTPQQDDIDGVNNLY